MARPSEYREEMVQVVIDYTKDGYTTNDEVAPTIMGLAEVLGVDEDTIGRWCKDPERSEFYGAVLRMKNKRKKMLLNGALKGRLNAKIAALELSSNFGMVSKTATDITTDGEKLPAQVIPYSPAIAAIAAEYEAKVIEEIKKSNQ